jgi:hypothetical protein
LSNLVIAFTYLLAIQNMTAAVTSNRGLFSASAPMSTGDRVLSSFSMNTPFGMGVAFQALWEGTYQIAYYILYLIEICTQEQASTQSPTLDSSSQVWDLVIVMFLTFTVLQNRARPRAQYFPPCRRSARAFFLCSHPSLPHFRLAF